MKIELISFAFSADFCIAAAACRMQVVSRRKMHDCIYNAVTTNAGSNKNKKEKLGKRALISDARQQADRHLILLHRSKLFPNLFV